MTAAGGRVALVTGAGRGIGAAIARALAADGCHLGLVELGEIEAARALAAELAAGGVRAAAFRADVADFTRAEQVVAECVDQLGGLDVLVCNAGITRDALVWNMTEADWDVVLAVDLKGCFNYARAAARHFKQQRGGRIVSVTSINGLRGKFGQANYSAAKAGVIALTKTLARELGKFGVTVNAVAPGMVLTEMAERLPVDVLDQALRETVLGRLATPEDVADAVAFLCSERARHITGEVIRVDGGQCM